MVGCRRRILLRTDQRMAFAMLGGIIVVGEAFLLWVLFKLTWDRSGKNRPKSRLDQPESPSPAAEQPQRRELETAGVQRA